MLELKIQKLEELKDWLESNYNSTESIWLVFPKKSAGADFAWSQVVDVLLCYGWIDSLPRKVDDKYTSIRISPRNPKSNWSKINKNKIEILDSKGLIRPNGYKTIQIAKQSGTWTALDEVENMISPSDFVQFLETNNLLESWEIKGKTFKKVFLQELLNTKKPETRLNKMQNLQL
jgi:uncharacterized protein YdeI (YjbR/CyaY-like superfamily)